MKKYFLGILSAVFMAIFGLNFVYAGVQDFTITEFKTDYYLDMDKDNRSTLKTVESITALFPEYDQNHGIERAVPKSYDGHTVNLKIESVKNEQGVELEYSTYNSGDFLILRIGEADTFVHGSNTYLITYTQRDVTKYFKNTNDDEFYWDANGTSWMQPIDKISVKIHLGKNIVSNLNDRMACYYGVLGSKEKCQIAKSGDIIIANSEKLKAGENMSVAIGFKPRHFAAYQKSALDIVLDYIAKNIGLAGVVVNALGLIFCIYLVTTNRSAKQKNSIVPQYLPPKDIDIVSASIILRKNGSWMPAAIIDLAVRHKIKVIEQNRKSFFTKGSYRLEFVSADGLTENETEIVSSFFTNNFTPGASFMIESGKPDSKLINTKQRASQKAKDMLKKDGYFIINKPVEVGKIIVTSMMLFMLIVGITVAISGLGSDILVLELLISLTTALVALALIGFHRPLSEKGVELRAYLNGLKMYIKVAEQDRLKYLQSPSGAEKTPIDTNNREQLVHLYERVLPYAILFGLEKEWSGVLRDYYNQGQLQPDWYAGTSAFDAAAFASSIAGLSSSISSSSSYSSSSGYSSSGGSGGGGFSGGGGGGGGGGGW